MPTATTTMATADRVFTAVVAWVVFRDRLPAAALSSGHRSAHPPDWLEN